MPRAPQCVRGQLIGTSVHVAENVTVGPLQKALFTVGLTLGYDEKMRRMVILRAETNAKA